MPRIDYATCVGHRSHVYPLSSKLAGIRLELKWIINDVLANQLCSPIINQQPKGKGGEEGRSLLQAARTRRTYALSLLRISRVLSSIDNYR